MRFIGGEDLVINAGDTITWTLEKNGAGTPHTITFLSATAEPDLVISETQANGQTNIFINPVVQKPSPVPPAPYAGVGYFNSGFLVAKSQTPQTYSLTFTQPGIYEYVCQIHDNMGMMGRIYVNPSPLPSATPTASPAATPSASPTPTASPLPSSSPSPTISPTASP